MKFNSTVSKDGLIQDCETLLGMEDAFISRDSTKLKQFTRMINNRMKQVNSLVWQATGAWEYDDSNQSDLPIATTTLVADQQDYEMPSYLQKIIRVEVKDANGNYVLLQEIDQSDITSAMTEFYETASMPVCYDLIGNSIFLYPKPSATDVTLALGLKIYFSREVKEFNSTATSTEPGMPDNFHRMLSIGAALDWCMGYSSDDASRINNLRGEWNAYQQEIQQFFGTRNVPRKLKINPSSEGIVGRI